MILGITGTIGAGKGTVVDYLKAKGFTHYSVREEITEEILRRGLAVDRPNMNAVGTDLRRNNAPDYFVTLFIRRATQDRVKDFVIESIRNVKEAEAIKAAGGFLLVVDADEHIRFDRVMARKSATDQVSFEEFRLQEAREMDSENPEDPAFMNMRAVISMADTTVRNDGTVDELHAQVDSALATLSV